MKRAGQDDFFFPFPEFSPVIRFFGGFPLHPFADPKEGF